MATELELPTQDEGSVYLAARKGARGEFLLSVKDRYRTEVIGQEESEVTLTRTDLLQVIASAALLLAEAEAEG